MKWCTAQDCGKYGQDYWWCWTNGDTWGKCNGNCYEKIDSNSEYSYAMQLVCISMATVMCYHDKNYVLPQQLLCNFEAGFCNGCFIMATVTVFTRTTVMY